MACLCCELRHSSASERWQLAQVSLPTNAGALAARLPRWVDDIGQLPLRMPLVKPMRRTIAAAPATTGQTGNADPRPTRSSCGAESSAGIIGFPPPSWLSDRLRTGGLDR